MSFTIMRDLFKSLQLDLGKLKSPRNSVLRVLAGSSKAFVGKALVKETSAYNSSTSLIVSSRKVP
ncbi:MAG TPA: hypothetical protein VJK07_01715 [Candidatus Nanoarchaeia archaeon]|nr:hypothetical protein [Candidatus Nanoarchaeia archaeon]